MTSDMTWQASGGRPQPLQAAREAARRSGMSVGEWLDSVIQESARQEPARQEPARQEPARQEPARQEPARQAQPSRREGDRRDAGDSGRRREDPAPTEPYAEVSAKLDTLSQQLERLATTSAAIGVSKPHRDDDQIASALSQLDRRLEQLMERRTRAGENERPSEGPASRRAGPPEAPTARPAPPSPLDQALAEIAERQRVLDGDNARSALPRAPSQGFGALEQQLRHINSQIESLKPGAINAAVDTLRDDLAQIGQAIREAMPRHAIEALETEVRSLAQRIDNKRDAGANTADLAGIEHALLEVRDALRAFTPAESLIGVESAVRTMSQKIDRIAAVVKDPTALEHLEDAIVGLRSVVSHVASNDALARLTIEVHALRDKVEQVASSDILATLEQRISIIADALQSRPQVDQDMQDLGALVQRLVDKIERLQLLSAQYPNSQLEQHIAKLIEKIESSDARFSQLDKIERGLAELLLQIDRQPSAQPMGGERAHVSEINTLKRDVQRTHDSIEAVHGTLGEVVDRLSVIETGLRGAPAQQGPGERPSEPEPGPTQTQELPGVPMAAASDLSALAALARTNPLRANPVRINPARANPADANPDYGNLPRPDWAPIETGLPPDHPLEPNHRYSPAERIAASQAALGAPRGTTQASGHPDAQAKANFIAAARRAAQAASSQLTERADRRVPELRRAHADDEIPSNALGGHARFLLIAASAVMVVLGSLQLFGFFSGPGEPGSPVAVAPDAPTITTSSTPRIEPEAAPATAPTQQPRVLAIEDVLSTPSAGVLPPLQPFAPASPDPSTSRDRTVTGSVRTPSAPPAFAPPPFTPPTTAPPVARTNEAEKLPAAITGGLRAAATKGDPAAEFEVAVRLAEGRGMPQNFTAAAEWFERAAQRGLVPAQFRLGGLYEKGMGVKKDLEAARRLYLAAANAGHAKAMHNLAVLYAEGADGKPDYQTAAYWFRRGADHGVTDSQYNLAILYARGIGVETNIAEAYKWFALAAREGDRDSAKKRDELGARLDAATAAAAQAAVRTWVAEPQPQAATQVKTPAGGWDGTPAAAPAKRRVTSDAKPTNLAPTATP
jgi:localization factor PodJL